MPIVEHVVNRDIVAASIGGGFLFQKNEMKFNPPAVGEVLRFFNHQIEQDHSVIAVIGGGPRARRNIELAKARGVTNPLELDTVGIRVTQENARLIEELARRCNLPIQIHEFGSVIHRGVIYIRGGDKPGHTTDYVAVQASHEAGQNILLNITAVPGVHPVQKGIIDKNTIIETISLDTYLQTIAPPSHAPGINTVFERPGAELAREYGMTIVIIGGKNPLLVFSNVRKFLKGENFTGTVIHP